MNTKKRSSNCLQKKTNRSESFIVDVSGRFAMFASPISKQNCEMMSYPMPTYSALCGIMRGIYYRPGITWVIEECRVMNEIKYQTITIKTPHYRIKSGRNIGRIKLFNYSFLFDARYQIKAHYVIDTAFVTDTHAYCGFVHGDAIRNCISNSQEKMVTLGKRCCGPAIVRPTRWGEDQSYYDDMSVSYPVYMFHSFRFDGSTKDRQISEVGFCRQVMENGIINFSKMKVNYQDWNSYRGTKK